MIDIRPTAHRRGFPLAVISLVLLMACEGQLPTGVTDVAAPSLSPVVSMAPSVSELFISEYVEGSSNNKALEIYNGTGGPVDLAAEGYSVQMFFNGSTSAGLTINLSGTVADGDVFVLAQSAAAAAILSQADQTSGAGWFNGDDVVVLRRGTTVVDAVGQVGVDPGSNWGSGASATANNTLRRIADVCQGDADPSDAFDPSVEWEGFGNDVFDGLGSHSAACGPAGPTELLLSEYVEGSSNNKALEIYNGTGTAVDLAAGGYAVRMYFNGSTSPGLTIQLSGMVASGDVHVVAHSSADPVILAQADQTNGAGWFNGDDVVVLLKGSDVVDAFGQVGVDPGTSWGTGTASSQDNTLRRLATVCQGDLDAFDAFDPGAEWDGLGNNVFGGLGTHSVDCSGTGGDAAPQVVAVTPADGATDVSVDADIVVSFSEPVSMTSEAFEMVCTSTGSHDPVVSGGPTDFTFNPNTLAGGETCTATIRASGVTDLDAQDPPDNLASDFTWSFTTGVPNVCGAPFTPIPAIQGSGPATPLSGQAVSTEGVVVGDFEGPSPTLRGFYLQDAAGDGDPATSDALFVFNGSADAVQLGDRVRVTGTAQEFQGQTQIGSVTSISVCATDAVVSPVDITFPVASTDFLERYEGMLVRLPQTLYVTEHSQLGRFGQVVMSSRPRLMQPTSVALPGAPAAAVQAANDLDRIIVDDDPNSQNPDPIVFGAGGNPLSAANTLRGGDSATGIVGVLTYNWGGNAASPNAYRVRPVGALGGGIPTFVPEDGRPLGPPAVGGTIKVGAFNVLNYFNTFSGCTAGAGGPAIDCRGAENTEEFERQALKIAAAIGEMGADVLGLIEIENDGYGPGSAIADLVDRLNATAGAGAWTFVDVDAATGQVNALGSDAIKVGLLYRPGRVTPVGSTAALDSPAFVNGGDGAPRSRPSLAQAFEDAAGGRFIVSVNHFKSKGSGCDVPDAGDGQGECNAVRTAAAAALVSWLASDPTGTGDTDVLILGDLNSYAMEDPIRLLESGGYVNLLAAYEGPDAYGYAFDGQWGYLDHALATGTLASQVTGVGAWHVNADEPNVLDYNTNFKSPGQLVSLFSPDAFRSSDHDPVLVGLELAPELRYDFEGFFRPVENLPAVNDQKAGSTVVLKFGLGGDQGMDVFQPGYPKSVQVTCSSWAGTGDPGEPLAGPGGTELTYSEGQYQLNWKTDKSWGGQCRELVVLFKDRTEVRARFRFR